MKKILIGCEESQTIAIAFRKLGFDAFSCDLLPCSGGRPEFHIHGDVFDAINSERWDLAIFHPECTFLTVTRNKYYKPEYDHRFPTQHADRKNAIDFFLKLANTDVPRWAIENPIGIMSSIYRKPDQIVHPYQFGDPERKSTCLWLKNLPKLIHTNVVAPEIVTFRSGKTMSRYHAESAKLAKEERRKLRSKTFQGIADAIADQWSKVI